MIKICEYCGKEYKTSKKTQKFCSRECAYENIKEVSKIKVVCLWCGKEKEIYKSHWKQNPNKIFYCGLECRDAARAANLLDKSEEQRRRSPWPEKVCIWCGKNFEIFPYREKRNKTGIFYCSFECMKEYRSTLLGVSHPRGTGEEVKCNYCGKTIYRKRSLIEKTELYFCDIGCRQKYEKDHISEDIKKYVRRSTDSKKLRTDCFVRDDYKSVISNLGGKIQHHHLNSLSLLFDLNNINGENFVDFYDVIYDLKNVVTLTEKEHRQFHRIYGYKTTKEQFLEYMEIKTGGRNGFGN